jgi:hypothetical protein
MHMFASRDNRQGSKVQRESSCCEERSLLDGYLEHASFFIHSCEKPSSCHMEPKFSAKCGLSHSSDDGQTVSEVQSFKASQDCTPPAAILPRSVVKWWLCTCTTEFGASTGATCERGDVDSEQLRHPAASSDSQTLSLFPLATNWEIICD